MSPPVRPLQALAVYAEPLVAGRSVVVFGEVATGLTSRLEELGASAVQVVTPDDDLAVLSGSRFDLALVPDLGQFDDPHELMARIRRSVGESGVALVAATNRDVAGPNVVGAFDYYDLFDLVAREFAEIRMIAQVPFHGVTLAEVGEDESPVVSVDTQLAEGEHAPDAFVALASQRGASLAPYAIIELPPVASPPRDDASTGVARAELAQERTRVQALSAQLETLEGRAARAAELDRDLQARVRQVAELSTEVEEMRAAAEAGRIAAAQVEELALRADRAERVITRIEPELERIVEGHALELGGFEEALRERAQVVRQLEEELARRERMVHDLVAALEDGAAPVAVDRAPSDGAVEVALVEENARLRERLDVLAMALARREGEAQAAAWAIAELEARLVRSAPRPEPPAQAEDQEQKLLAALDELDALRKAFVQEHEARARAETAARGAEAPDRPAAEPA